jgi:protein-disulfide isomerase
VGNRPEAEEVNKRYVVGAIVAAVVVVGVLVGLSLAGGGGDDETVSSITGVKAVQAEFKGVPQSGNVLGDPDAPVNIIEYGDTSCPACKLASETTVPEAIDRLVRSGEVKMTFRPIAFISPSSERGAFGAEAAAMQDAMWPFVTLLYRNQGPENQDWLSDELMQEAVKELGLDVDLWKSDYSGQASEEKFLATRAQADQDQVNVTPTFIVRGPRGEKTLTGAAELSELEAAVAEVGPQT